MKFIELLEKCKQATQTESNYALAKRLGIERRLINFYFKNGRKADFYTCLRVAEILEISRLFVLIVNEIEYEKDAEKKAYLEKIATKLFSSTTQEQRQTKSPLHEVLCSEQLHQLAD